MIEARRHHLSVGLPRVRNPSSDYTSDWHLLGRVLDEMLQIDVHELKSVLTSDSRRTQSKHGERHFVCLTCVQRGLTPHKRVPSQTIVNLGEVMRSSRIARHRSAIRYACVSRIVRPLHATPALHSRVCRAVDHPCFSFFVTGCRRLHPREMQEDPARRRCAVSL